MAYNLHTHADRRALQETHKVCWRPAGPAVVRTLPVWHMHPVGRTRRASARAWTPRRLGTHLLGTSSGRDLKFSNHWSEIQKSQYRYGTTDTLSTEFEVLRSECQY